MHRVENGFVHEAGLFWHDNAIAECGSKRVEVRVGEVHLSTIKCLDWSRHDPSARARRRARADYMVTGK